MSSLANSTELKTGYSFAWQESTITSNSWEAPKTHIREGEADESLCRRGGMVQAGADTRPICLMCASIYDRRQGHKPNGMMKVQPPYAFANRNAKKIHIAVFGKGIPIALCQRSIENKLGRIWAEKEICQACLALYKHDETAGCLIKEGQ